MHTSIYHLQKLPWQWSPAPAPICRTHEASHGTTGHCSGCHRPTPGTENVTAATVPPSSLWRHDMQIVMLYIFIYICTYIHIYIHIYIYMYIYKIMWLCVCLRLIGTFNQQYDVWVWKCGMPVFNRQLVDLGVVPYFQTNLLGRHIEGLEDSHFWQGQVLENVVVIIQNRLDIN